jgi:hypothetical protein
MVRGRNILPRTPVTPGPRKDGGSGRRRQRPWRYHRPGEFRAQDERLRGVAATTSPKRQRVSSGPKTPPDSDPQQSLFDP